jgi:hypothetical protein
MFDGYFWLVSIITLKEALQNRKWTETWYSLPHTDLSQLAIVIVKTPDLSFLVEWHKGSETLTQCQWASFSGIEVLHFYNGPVL